LLHMVHVTLSVLSEVHSPHPVPQLKQEVFATDKMVPLGQVVHCAPGLEQVSQLSTSVQAAFAAAENMATRARHNMVFIVFLVYS